MKNGRTGKEGKPLEIAKTIIGVKKGKYHGEQIEFSIYYGNLSLPLVDDKFVHLTPEKYDALLHDFLYETQEGKVYAVPDEEESRKAMQLVLDKEGELLKQILKDEEPQPAEETTIIYDRQELEQLYNLKELEDPKPAEETSDDDFDSRDEQSFDSKQPDESKKTDEPVSEQQEEKTTRAKQKPEKTETAESGDLLNQLKTKTTVQFVLIVFQFICIVILAILLLSKG